VPARDPLAPWGVPHGREHLAGSAVTSGPGGAGTADLWSWGRRAVDAAARAA
jgi:putative glutathione S-transferase